MLSLKRLGLPPNLVLQSSESIINVDAGIGSINYTSNNASVNLDSEISVNAGIGSISYNSNPAQVELSGLIDIPSGIGQISYNSLNTVVSLTDGSQTIGTVTVSYKPFGVTVQYKG